MASLCCPTVYFLWSREGGCYSHVTVFMSSLTWCGWSSLSGTQWLHQTLRTHILSCLTGKAIKHESSRDPRLCMIYSGFLVSSQITLHLLFFFFCQRTEWVHVDFCSFFHKVNTLLSSFDSFSVTFWTGKCLMWHQCGPMGVRSHEINGLTF